MQELYSISRLSVMFQRSPRRILNELSAMGVEPKLVLDGVLYFDSKECEKIFSQLNELAKNPPMIYGTPSETTIQFTEGSDDE